MHGSERAYPTHDQLKHARESIALGSPPSAPMTPTPPPVAYSSPPTVPRAAVSFEYFKLGSAPKSKRSWTKRWAPMNVVSSRGERYFEFFQHQVGVCASNQRRFDAVFKSSLDCSHERRISKPARHNFCMIADQRLIEFCSDAKKTLRSGCLSACYVRSSGGGCCSGCARCDRGLP
jgi:hypothetical protein